MSFDRTCLCRGIMGLAAAVLFAGCATPMKKADADYFAAEASSALSKEDYKTARQWAVKAQQADPNVAEYLVTAGFASVKLGDRKAATKYYEKALPILMKESQKDPERVDDLAMVLYLLGREYDALAALEGGVARFPANAQLKETRKNYKTLFNGFAPYSVVQKAGD